MATDLAATHRQMQGRKRKAGRAPAKTRAVRPTDEFTAKNDTQSAGMAVRVVPVIDTLRKDGKLTNNEHEVLKAYGEAADAVHRSEVKSNLDRQIRATGGGGASPAMLHAKEQLSRLDGILGDLRGVCVAVCRDNKTLSEYACERFGSRERMDRGKVRMVPRGEGRIDSALWELKFAAARLRD